MENRRRQIKPKMKRVSRKNRKKGAPVFNRLFKPGPSWKVIAGATVLLLVSICFVSGYGFFVRSDCLRVKDVQVEGASVLSREAVIDRAGIETGTNILAVNLAVARKRLQADPWIAEVRISRVLPSTIMIGVREHEPVAVMEWGDGFLINSRREVFKRVELTDPVSLPVIIGVDCDDLDMAGRSASPVLNAALDAVETAAIIGRRVPGMRIGKVIADRDTGLTLCSLGVINEVRLGFDDDHDNYLKKFKRLNHLLKHRASRGGNDRLAAAGFESPGRVVVKAVAGDSYAVIQKGGKHEGT